MVNVTGLIQFVKAWVGGLELVCSVRRFCSVRLLNNSVPAIGRYDKVAGAHGLPVSTIVKPSMLVRS